jgi:serine/threonine protein phosphatase 1
VPRVIDRLDLSDKRKVFAVGDIHGCFSMLWQKLRVLGFNKEQDFLVSVGDLVDRGPESHLAIQFVKEPWFKHVVGNHEEFCVETAKGNSYMHFINGGLWMEEMSDQEKREQARILMDTSYLLEIITPAGKKVGFVHADLPYNSWEENIKYPHLEAFAWSRGRIRRWQRDKTEIPHITGIDHVFLGHTVTDEPVTAGNMSWIDTGACFGENRPLTVVNVDEWITNLNQ